MRRNIPTRLVFLILVTVLLNMIVLPGFATAASEESEKPDIEFNYNVKAALMMETDTGKVIFARNDRTKLYPASVTKIMTVLLAMEDLEEGKIHLDDMVAVSSRAASMGGSQLFLSEGDRVSLEKMLIGIMVASANDAAVAVAEHISGSVEAFVDRMNRRADDLGMKNTCFVNPHGLHDENHYTTAGDIGIMSRELLDYPLVHELANLWMDEHFLEDEIKSGGVYLSNTNKLIRYYQGCDGLKTGFTNEADHCIAATAKRGDTRFLAIILGGATSDERYDAARALLNYGFSRYQSVPLVKKGEVIKVMPVEKGDLTHVNIVAKDNLSLLYPRGKKVEFEKEILLPEHLKAPLKKGQKVGEINATFMYEQAGIDLVAVEGTARAGYFKLAGRLFSLWLSFGRR
ncbi:MAG: D-alanyl-D-alanine carboxypeptidase [Firmicutes bacterium]|nr:D-alanyl-D-alanine carboxypeptidase [Bacillota bacterium]